MSEQQSDPVVEAQEPGHNGPDPLETIFVKIEKSLKNLQNASKSYNKTEFCLWRTLNVIRCWLEIGPNYHITVMFDPNNMGQ